MSAALDRDFRLLETIRAYAIEILGESDERQYVARRHAEYYRNLFEHAEIESMARLADDRLADYAQEIDNLRAALEWAFLPGGDDSIGVALTVAAISALVAIINDGGMPWPRRTGAHFST